MMYMFWPRLFRFHVAFQNGCILFIASFCRLNSEKLELSHGSHCCDCCDRSNAALHDVHLAKQRTQGIPFPNKLSFNSWIICWLGVPCKHVNEFHVRVIGVLPGCVEYEIGPSSNRQLVKQLDVRKLLRGTLRQTQFPAEFRIPPFFKVTPTF